MEASTPDFLLYLSYQLKFLLISAQISKKLLRGLCPRPDPLFHSTFKFKRPWVFSTNFSTNIENFLGGFAPDPPPSYILPVYIQQTPYE